jgi:hypothetical protein
MRRAAAGLSLLTAAACATPPPVPAVASFTPLGAEAELAGDDRAAFRAEFCAALARLDPDGPPCEDWLWRAPDEPPPAPPPPGGPLATPWRLLLVSGYGSDCFAPWFRLFGDARDHLAALGATVEDAPVAGLASGGWNARLVGRAIRDLALAPGERLAVIGYSKGAADMLEAFAADPAAAARVDAAVSLHGALRGAVLAETAPALLNALIAHAPGTVCGPNDGGALEAMRPALRQAWLAAHPPPRTPRLLALAGFQTRERVSTILHGGWDDHAARGAPSDGQLTPLEQTAPGAILLGHPAADHWAAALPIAAGLPVAAVAVDRNDFPRAALAEAIVRHLDRAPLRRP